MMQVSQFRALRRAQSTMHSRPVQSALTRAFSAQSDADVEVCEQEMLRALDKFQKDAASSTVPWFLENMPPSYFRSVHEEDRVQHLNAITALLGAEQPEVLLRSPDQTIFSHFRSGANFPGRLVSSKLDRIRN
ncbi:hypothetical protein PF005_g14751 [Phytophthora fragariae]|uniref:Uncharacterized protein n=1 Tax=Phytophthora fragariae TaxID=53985 RepID=A0A6A3K9X2_9STRA|nr:hypothetical protein PF009_g16418 [Phytophthora fragariae]KAE9001475.1 hypothetical protein PF011_g13733 [Phytophthora fragariae]KAE9101292.1 hypothetical protein PF010_g14507 [Phytophthora fragariae]KAE9101634.1 hypothetical protein PF007_g15072 [Phytophthora fragariae]KAE9138831.1 hypothetical protein PF006_g13888 [Phytophthora fragariae]